MLLEKEKLDRFESLSVLLKDRCFEKGDDRLYPSDYEIRGLEIFEIGDRRFLSYGDKRGLFKIFNRTTNELVHEESFGKVIDSLVFQSFPSRLYGLLFVCVRFMGVYVYRVETGSEQTEIKKLEPVTEENKFISFFYPNIAIDESGSITRNEAWVCFEDGDFRIYTGGTDYSQWNLNQKIMLPYVITDYALNCTCNTLQGNVNLFLGNSAGEIFCIPFQESHGINFPLEPDHLDIYKILTIHGAMIEGMIPLSDYRFFYPGYCGCLVQSGNKLLCVYFDIDKNPKDEGSVHTLAKTFPNQLLDIKCLPFNDFCYTAVSDIDGNIYLIKNVTDMIPSGRNIEVIFDGECFSIPFDDRVVNMRFAPRRENNADKHEALYNAYLGMGNHFVLPVSIYNYETKFEEAAEAFYDLTGAPRANRLPFPPDLRERILDSIENILDRFRFGSSGAAVKQLILQLMANIAETVCKNNDSFLGNAAGPLSRIFYKVIENESRELIIKTGEFLTRIEKCCKLSPGVVTELQVHLKKFILDPQSYSKKSERLKELVEYNETAGNMVDAYVYKGILCDRQYDLISHLPFDNETEGEISRFVPLKHNANQFIVCTSKGYLFLVDFNLNTKTQVFQYRKSNIDKDTENFERINNIYVGKTQLYLLVRHNEIVSLPIGDVNLTNDFVSSQRIPFPEKYKSDYGTAVCMMPHHSSQEDECFVGSNRGNIFHLLPGGTIHDIYTDSSNTSMILDLRAFAFNTRFLVVAAYWNGIVRVFEYFPGEPIDRLELLSDISVDVHSVNRLLVFTEGESYDRFPLIIAGTDSGRCYGIRMYEHSKEKSGIGHIFEWCYNTGEPIKGIHFASLSDTQHYILISSMDSNLHILNRNGISINTIHFHSHTFQVFIPTSGMEENRWFSNGFVSTSENVFQKIRLLVKSKVIEEIDTFFSSAQKLPRSFSVTDPETLLLKFKSIDIKEKHFKIRYYLKSRDFDSAENVLNEIDATLARGKEKEETYILVALINRLFSEFFDEILTDGEKFGRTKRLFLRSCNQWGYEGSKNNTIAQLYWIRSMLKGCFKSKSPVKTLKRWFEVSSTAAQGLGIVEADSGDILRRFIMNTIPFMRVKTLQYLYRFITFPESKRSEKEKWEPQIVKILTDSVIKILKMFGQKKPAQPEWFELEAARFLAWVVVNFKYTGFCPFKLLYYLWQNNIPYDFFFRLADAISIYPEKIEGKSAFESVVRAAGTLISELERDNPRFIELFPRLTVFSPRCMEGERCCNDEMSNESLRFFDGIRILLDFKDIGDFNDTTKLDVILKNRNCHYFKSQPIFDRFYDLSQKIKKYHREKHSDIYGNIMISLDFSTFHDIKTIIKTITELIEAGKEEILWMEKELLSFVLRHWSAMIKDEIDNNVILDFANAIREYNRLCTNDNLPIDMPLIFRNIFTRLNIIAECDESYLLYLTHERKQIKVFHKSVESKIIVEELNLKKAIVPDEWLKPAIFSVLDEEDVKVLFQDFQDCFMSTLLKAPGLEPADTVALYLFFWNKDNPGEISRLESREILGEFITTAAYLQSALQEQKERQEEFFRIVSHELNQIIRGSLGWISILETGKIEDKPDMRKEYYKRLQHSLISADHVIKSILSFRGTARYDLKLCDLDMEIEKIVKLARIDYKNYGDIKLEYFKEKGNYGIITDPILVGTAVVNLLNNARKYNPQKKLVEMRLFIQGSNIVIEVKDIGVGIPQNEYDIVFKLFERGKYPKKNYIDGLGIGLAVSKNNIELLGGKISFTSQVDVGSTFRITLDKKRFQKYHMIETWADMKRPPNFNAVKEIELRQKIEEKLKYDSYRKKLLLRGLLSEEELDALKACYHNDESQSMSDFLKAIEKLYHESNEKLQEFSHE